MKKNRNESRDEGVGKRADEEERKKKCNKDPASNEKRKEGKRKRKKQKIKRWKRKKSTKVGIHIPHPPALEYKNKKKFLD